MTHLPISLRRDSFRITEASNELFLFKYKLNASDDLPLFNSYTVMVKQCCVFGAFGQLYHTTIFSWTQR